MPTASGTIIRQIESLGYAVSVHRIPEGEPVHIARHRDGAGDDEEYEAACRLAEMVGIDLKG